MKACGGKSDYETSSSVWQFLGSVNEVKATLFKNKQSQCLCSDCLQSAIGEQHKKNNEMTYFFIPPHLRCLTSLISVRFDHVSIVLVILYKTDELVT